MDKWKLSSKADKTRRLGLVSRPSFSVHPALQLCHFLFLFLRRLYPWQSMGFLPYAFYLWSTNSQPAHFHLVQCLSLPPGYIFLDGKDWSDSSFYPHRVTQSLINICSIQFQDLVQVLTSFCHSYAVLTSFSKPWKHFYFIHLIYCLAYAPVYCCFSFWCTQSAIKQPENTNMLCCICPQT